MTFFKKLLVRLSKPGFEFKKFENLGSANISRTIAVGQHDEELKVEVLPGRYQGYFLSSDTYDEYYDKVEESGQEIEFVPDRLLVVHETFAGQIDGLFKCRARLGDFFIEGAAFVAYDTEMTSDKSFMDDLKFEGMGVIRERGFKVTVDGDGSAEVFVLTKSGSTVGVCIEAK